MTTRPGPVPTLHAHDRLCRAEFERRYAAMPATLKAELLDGAVYVASPVRHAWHGRPHTILSAWLAFYVEATPGLDLGDNSTLRLDGDNEPQPDLLLRLPERVGGQSRVDGEGFLVGAPEFVAEITASSVSYDLHQKFEVYRRSGVMEYVVHRVEDGEVDWFVLREGRYVLQPRNAESLLRSGVFPGLWLDVEALLRGDLRALRAAVQRGCAEPAHGAFAAYLAG